MTALEDQARSLFLAALDCAPDRWPAFVEEACRGNAELRARVDQLLQAHQASGSIHGGPAASSGNIDEPITAHPGMVIGPYKLMEQIGEGGMVLVIRAVRERPTEQRLADACAEERRRIARALHDQMGQHLAALGLGLKSLEEAVHEVPAADRLVHQLRELTDRIGHTVHDLALQLRPPALDELGLHTTLVNHLEDWSARCGIEVDFQSTGLEEGRLAPRVETAFYRTVQEALTNVLKHAGARRVSVILQRAPGQVVAVIEDDGRGFDPAAVGNGTGGAGHLGLTGMRERLELVGGTLTVESTPGGGTTLIARVPLPGSPKEVSP
jgi:signal transduction histidine kinase